MAVRTIDELQDRLDSGLSWRRTELLTLKTQIRSAFKESRHSPLTRALARSGTAMLYAHWEGYVKEACQAYVDYVAKRRLLVSELNDGLLKVVLDHLNRRAISGDGSAAEALMAAVRSPAVARAKIPKDSIVDTKSNLRAAVLKDILDSIGFSDGKFATRQHLIDKALCDARNTIAHGREFFPDPEEFDSLHGDVMEMLEDIRDMILQHAREQKYKRPHGVGLVDSGL